MLNRPHIELVPVQLLPWHRIPPAPAECKFLCRDADDGACSCVLRHHAGWQRQAEESRTPDQEFDVLQRSFEVDGQVYGPDCCVFLPTCWPRRHMV